MKKKFSAVLFLIALLFPKAFSQTSNDTIAYLLTCGPGTETYSIYGHSAVRIVIPAGNFDAAYNWGLFDFSTKNFAWKFAKGRLDYMVGAERCDSFLKSYLEEERYVYSQRINLNPKEMRIFISLINENIKPENAKYRYDFFYDDCSTRIRDLFEKAVGENLKYPPEEPGKNPTFRDMVAKYQNPYPWYRFGVDLIMGSTSDKEANFRDRMFLPVDMMEELSKTRIRRDDKMIPLLQNPVTLVNFQPIVVKPNLLLSPPFVFTLVIIVIMIMAALIKSRKIIRWIDIFIYSIFSILAVLMIFFNFFTDHQQMRMNLNIIWLNPFIIICLFMLILNKTGLIWFRIVFYISAVFLVLQLLLPQEFHTAFLLLDIIILIRSSVRSEFDWNPLTLKKGKV
jgi:hypothetical protein